MYDELESPDGIASPVTGGNSPDIADADDLGEFGDDDVPGEGIQGE